MVNLDRYFLYWISKNNNKDTVIKAAKLLSLPNSSLYNTLNPLQVVYSTGRVPIDTFGLYYYGNIITAPDLPTVTNSSGSPTSNNSGSSTTTTNKTTETCSIECKCASLDTSKWNYGMTPISPIEGCVVTGSPISGINCNVNRTITLPSNCSCIPAKDKICTPCTTLGISCSV